MIGILRSILAITTNGMVTSVSAQWPECIERWRSTIEPTAARYHIDPALIAAMIQTESGGDPSAYRTEPWLGLDAIGQPVASVGLLQVVTFPWRNITAEELRTPGFNIYYGTRLFSQILQSNDHDVRVSLAIYNCGSVGVAEKRCGRWGGLKYADTVLSTCRDYGGCIPSPFMDRRRWQTY